MTIGEDEAKTTAPESERVQRHIAGKDIARVVYVPSKLVNIVAR